MLLVILHVLYLYVPFSIFKHVRVLFFLIVLYLGASCWFCCFHCWRSCFFFVCFTYLCCLITQNVFYKLKQFFLICKFLFALSYCALAISDLDILLHHFHLILFFFPLCCCHLNLHLVCCILVFQILVWHWIGNCLLHFDLPVFIFCGFPPLQASWTPAHPVFSC